MYDGKLYSLFYVYGKFSKIQATLICFFEMANSKVKLLAVLFNYILTNLSYSISASDYKSLESIDSAAEYWLVLYFLNYIIKCQVYYCREINVLLTLHRGIVDNDLINACFGPIVSLHWNDFLPQQTHQHWYTPCKLLYWLT